MDPAPASQGGLGSPVGSPQILDNRATGLNRLRCRMAFSQSQVEPRGILGTQILSLIMGESSARDFVWKIWKAADSSSDDNRLTFGDRHHKLLLKEALFMTSRGKYG
ncbi:hypothetical protein VYU27_005967 [Nannochloropsis oceanica]